MDSAPPFFPPLEPFTPQQLAERLSLPIANESEAASQPLTGVAPIEQASQGDLSFIDNPKYRRFARETRAACVIMKGAFADELPSNSVGLVSDKPYDDFAKAAALMVPSAINLRGAWLGSGIAQGAHVHPSATLEADVTVEPGAVVGPNASVGSGSTICAGAVIAHDCQIGRQSYIGPGAQIQHALVGDRCIVHAGVAVGQDGFGFAMGASGHRKVPQVGRVIIQDDVEIGANSCVDRGTTRDTIIGEGTKIDNLVQIGHNAVIGRHCVIVGHVGVSGSATLEDFVVLGGQVGIGGHITLGMGAQIAASSHVKDDVPPGGKWAGTPARPAREVFREVAAIRKLARKS